MLLRLQVRTGLETVGVPLPPDAHAMAACLEEAAARVEAEGKVVLMLLVANPRQPYGVLALGHHRCLRPLSVLLRPTVSNY